MVKRREIIQLHMNTGTREHGNADNVYITPPPLAYIVDRFLPLVGALFVRLVFVCVVVEMHLKDRRRGVFTKRRYVV